MPCGRGGKQGSPDAEEHGTVATGQELGGENWTESMALPGWSEMSWAHLGGKPCHSSSSLSDWLLFSFTVPHGLLGPGPVANGFPPGGPGGPKGMQHFPPGPGGPMPGR